MKLIDYPQGSLLNVFVAVDWVDYGGNETIFACLVLVLPLCVVCTVITIMNSEIMNI